MTESSIVSVTNSPDNAKAISHQLRVSALILQPDRGVLLCRFSRLPFWMLPGGRVKEGEDLAHALCRELLEELGSPLVAATLRWVIENYFSVQNRPMAEVGFYFATELPAGAAVEDAFAGREEGLEFRWWPLADLPRIDLRPANLAALLLDGGASSFEHRLWRD